MIDLSKSINQNGLQNFTKVTSKLFFKINQILKLPFKRINKGSFQNSTTDSKLQSIERLSFVKTSVKEISLPSTVLFLGEMWCNEETSVTKMQNKLVHVSISTLDHDKSPKTLFYQRKNSHFTKTILDPKHQFNKIEILSKEKKCFSLTDFIIFASEIYPKIISAKPRRSTAKGIYLILTAISI